MPCASPSAKAGRPVRSRQRKVASFLTRDMDAWSVT
jgi:hypothetical protein